MDWIFIIFIIFLMYLTYCKDSGKDSPLGEKYSHTAEKIVKSIVNPI